MDKKQWISCIESDFKKRISPRYLNYLFKDLFTYHSLTCVIYNLDQILVKM